MAVANEDEAECDSISCPVSHKWKSLMLRFTVWFHNVSFHNNPAGLKSLRRRWCKNWKSQRIHPLPVQAGKSQKHYPIHKGRIRSCRILYRIRRSESQGRFPLTSCGWAPASRSQSRPVQGCQSWQCQRGDWSAFSTGGMCSPETRLSILGQTE